MATTAFPKHKNFELTESHWGTAINSDVITVLESAINALFFSCEKSLIPKITVTIDHINFDPNNAGKVKLTPMWYPGDSIFLNCIDAHWSQYIFQFSHELCHHLIAKHPNINDNFKWLEEGFCQLASFFVLKKLAHNWSVNPPSLEAKLDGDEHEKYADNYYFQNLQYTLNTTFKNWLLANLATLYAAGYDEQKQIIIGINLFPVFRNKPALWECVQYYNKVDCNAKGITTLSDFLSEWENVLPKRLKKRFKDIKDTLI